MNANLSKIGIVVIGRNEGERLQRCLLSVVDSSQKVIYVDSGSTDGSVEFARSLCVEIVDLDMSHPFTMARGRNAGFVRLMELSPDIEFVQFIDGDCEVVAGYLEKALAEMSRSPEAVVVTGRRMERHPQASIYNRLCDLEWGRGIGEIESCGGDMLVRAKAFAAAGMFNPNMIAGEEPELCVRLRLQGGKILRIDRDMTLHDAAMFRFSQWWKRAKRAGHAYAEGAFLQGDSPFRHNVRQVRSALFWGGIVPAVAAMGAIAAVWQPWAGIIVLMSCLAYAVLSFRIFQRARQQGWDSSDSRLYAISCVLSKIPCCLGVIQFCFNRLRGKQSLLIEYKQSQPNRSNMASLQTFPTGRPE